MEVAGQPEGARAVEVARQPEAPGVVEVARQSEGARAVEVAGQPEGAGPADVQREGAALAQGSTWRGHSCLWEERNGGPCCHREPGPRSVRETVPLVPRSAGLREEGM